MCRICRSVFIISLIIANCCAYGAVVYDAPSRNAVESGTVVAPRDGHYEVPDTDMPFVSINTDMHRDLNWTAALEFSDPALRPVPVVLPLLDHYPFDNLEIKLRVLNLKF